MNIINTPTMLYNTRLIWIFQIHCTSLAVKRKQSVVVPNKNSRECVLYKMRRSGSAVACSFSALICGRDTLEILSKTRIVWVSLQFFFSQYSVLNCECCSMVYRIFCVLQWKNKIDCCIYVLYFSFEIRIIIQCQSTCLKYSFQ